MNYRNRVEDASVEEAPLEVQVSLELNERVDEREVMNKGSDLIEKNNDFSKTEVKDEPAANSAGARGDGSGISTGISERNPVTSYAKKQPKILREVLPRSKECHIFLSM